MQAHRIETVWPKKGRLTLESLPFQAGERLEIIILARGPQTPQADRYPLRGTPIEYHQPTEPVAQNDWEATSRSF